MDDPDCPDELKVLVSDRISTHRRFEKAHGQLSEIHKKGALPEFETLARAATNFEENRLIHEELDFYAEEKKVLGKHPKLWKLALQQDIDERSELWCFKRLRSVRANISRDRKKLKSLKGDARQKFEAKLDKWELEKQLLEIKLNGQ